MLSGKAGIGLLVLLVMVVVVVLLLRWGESVLTAALLRGAQPTVPAPLLLHGGVLRLLLLGLGLPLLGVLLLLLQIPLLLGCHLWLLRLTLLLPPAARRHHPAIVRRHPEAIFIFDAYLSYPLGRSAPASAPMPPLCYWCWNVGYRWY